MVEENSFGVSSSQESLPMSQETFEYIWNELARSGISAATDVVNVDAIVSSGSQILIDGIKTEVLDSCDLNNAANEQEVNLQVDECLGQLHQVGQIAIPASVPVRQQISPAVSEVQHVPSSLPASQTWPGDYGFTVSFNPQSKNTKGVAWTYSKIKDKLYVGKDAPCPINFSANTSLPSDVCIRVMALYTSPEQVSEIVKRCVNHSMDEIHNGVYEAEHLIRCESSMSSYQIDSTTGRHSVIIPFENPAAGQQFSTYIYKFACFGSCAGGPNRRPLMLIFTLEKGNQVIGRRKLDVKICACPGRDRKTEETQFMEAENAHRVALKRKEPGKLGRLSDAFNFTQSVYYPPPKKAKHTPSRDGFYTINAENRDCYEFLLQMKKFYEMCKSIADLTPDVTKALHYYQRKKNNEKSD